jgi:hypothetical protein
VLYASDAEQSQQSEPESTQRSHDVLPNCPLGRGATTLDYVDFALGKVDKERVAACFRAGKIRVACFCAGAMTEEVALGRIRQIWDLKYQQEHGVAIDIELTMVVEKNDKKRANLLAAHHIKHCYADMIAVGEGKRVWDFALEKMGQPPDVDMVISGYPCKDLSLLNNAKKRFRDRAGRTGGRQP